MAPGVDAVIARNGRIYPPAAPPFTVVVDPNGGGDVRTFMEAWALMPAAGGTIRLKTGTYSITATCQIKAGQTIAILGDSPGSFSSNAGVLIRFLNGTVFDFLAFDSTLQIRNVNLAPASGGGGQILFDSNISVPFPNTPGGVVDLQNVVASVNASSVPPAAGRIFRRIFSITASECDFTVSGGNDGALAEDCVNITGYKFSGSGVSDIIVVAGSAPTLKLDTFNLLSARVDALAGFRFAGNSRFVGGELSVNNAAGSVYVAGSLCYFSNVRFYGPGAGIIVLTVSGDRTIIHGCTINGRASVTGSYNIFGLINFETGGGGTGAIRESGGADYNLFAGIAPKDPFATSDIVTLTGANSFCEGLNCKAIASGTTLDRTHQTVLVPGGTVILPSAVLYKQQSFTIKNTSASPLVVSTVAGNIDGLATVTLTNLYGAIRVISDGTDWNVLYRFNGSPSSGLFSNIQSVAADTVLDATYATVLVSTAGGARLITLPNATTCKGRIYVVKKTTADANAVNVASGGGTLDGAVGPVAIVQQYASLSFQSDGTNWWIV